MSTNTRPPVDRLPSVRSLCRRLNETALTTPVQLVGFWASVGLPLVQLHYLVGGIETVDEAATFGLLLAVNLLALLVGHSYRSE